MTSQPPNRLARLTLTPKHSTRPGFITRVGGVGGCSREKPNSREKKATRPAPHSTESSNSDPETDLDTENVADPLHIDDPHDLTVVNRKLYERKCRQVGVVPINLFIRHMEDTELSLRGRQCGPDGARALAAPLMLNRSLTKLDLGSNSVEDRGARHLVDKLIENVALQELNLSENNLTIEGAKLVCQLVLMNSNIRTLDVSGNHFGDKAAPMFAAMLTQCQSLLTLNLSNNDLGAESGLLLGPAIASNDTLRELDLSWNHIRLKGACAIAQGIKENIRLLKVDLSWNGFDVDGAKALGATLAENGVLERLNLAGNRMSDVAIMHIATGLGRNEGLLELNMDNNPMTNVGAFGLIHAVFKSESCTLNTLHITDIPVRDDFLDVLYELRTKREFDVSYLELNKRKQNNIQRTNTLLSYLKKKELTIYDLFASTSEKTPPNEVSRDAFLDKLKTLSVPLSNRQLNEVASTLDTHKHGVLDLRPLLEKEGTLLPGSPTPESSQTQINQYVQTASGIINQSEAVTTPRPDDNNQSEPASTGNFHGNNKPGSAKHKGSKTASRHSNKPAGSTPEEAATRTVSRHGDDPPGSAKDNSTGRLSNRSNHSNGSSKNNHNNTESP